MEATLLLLVRVRAKRTGRERRYKPPDPQIPRTIVTRVYPCSYQEGEIKTALTITETSLNPRGNNSFVCCLFGNRINSRVKFCNHPPKVKRNFELNLYDLEIFER